MKSEQLTQRAHEERALELGYVAHDTGEKRDSVAFFTAVSLVKDPQEHLNILKSVWGISKKGSNLETGTEAMMAQALRNNPTLQRPPGYYGDLESIPVAIQNHTFQPSEKPKALTP